MELFRRLFFAAVLAGAVAGLVLGLVQQWRVVPLILQAEHYETGTHSHGEAETHVHADGSGHIHEAAEPVAEPWAPADGFERTAYTILATLLAGIGFAFILGAVSVISGIEITLATGTLWGLGGFLAFALAPAFGLPPELPGMPAADLVPRQIWWWGTVLLTGAAILGMAKFRNAPAIGMGLVLILLPHIFGAPIAPDQASAVPAHLATAFAASALTAAMVYWLLVGTLIGWFNQIFAKGAF